MTMPPDPQRCEPPAEHRGERWHWLRTENHSRVPAMWRGGAWEMIGRNREYNSRELADTGYRWLAVAKPPEGT